MREANDSEVKSMIPPNLQSVGGESKENLFCFRHKFQKKEKSQKPRTFSSRSGLTLIQCFQNCVDYRGQEDCWEWNGSRDPNGYGYFNFKGDYYRAHRLAFEWAHGPIPTGLFVCHRCDNPPCCNPAHLFVGSNSDNMQDAIRKGRFRMRLWGNPEKFKPWYRVKQQPEAP